MNGLHPECMIQSVQSGCSNDNMNPQYAGYQRYLPSRSTIAAKPVDTIVAPAKIVAMRSTAIITIVITILDFLPFR